MDDWDENSLKEYKHRGCSSFYISIYRTHVCCWQSLIRIEFHVINQVKLSNNFVDYITNYQLHIDIFGSKRVKKRPCRMSLRPKNGCVAVSILRVNTPNILSLLLAIIL